MATKKKIALLVPDGVGIKNYLYSNVFKDLSASLTLLHNFDTDTIAHISEQINIDDFTKIPTYDESIREKFLRELIHLSRIKHNVKLTGNKTIHHFYKREHKSLKLKIFYTLIEFVSWFVKGYSFILTLERWYESAIRKNRFYSAVESIFLENRPDIVFCTHQRALKSPTVFAAARDMGIKTVTVIYSWDNIPKARLALKADLYLVWSTYMKKELTLFYPEIPSEKIKITGTPQFEFYKNPEFVIEREEFFERFGLDKKKKSICFSGDDEKTSPHDPNYLNDLACQIIEAGMENNCQVILRRCPVDISGRYDWVMAKFPELIIAMPPLWNYNTKIWSAVYPTYEDVSVLVSLAYYTDVVVNVGSTMAFDFGMFDKPCIFINYDTIIDKKWSVKTIYNFQHFKSLPEKNAVYWFNSQNEIVSVLKNALYDPNTTIKKWIDIVVENLGSASEKIKNELK